jgi:hypothetical protein
MLVVVTQVVDMVRGGVYGEGDRGDKVRMTGITQTNASRVSLKRMPR